MRGKVMGVSNSWPQGSSDVSVLMITSFFRHKLWRSLGRMAARRVYGGQEMNCLLQSDGFSSENFEALLSSSSSHGGFSGSRSMLNFEDVVGAQSFCWPGEMDEATAAAGDSDEGFHHVDKKRRLSATQVQFLEKSFEAENKLEPERKLQLARDLGLQPRQVAIWFQNRRARWKTKQLERDYEALRASYDALRANYDSLLKEKDELKAEVAELTGKLLLKENKCSGGDSSAIETKTPEAHLAEVKQEVQSSANSAVSDSESPRCDDDGARDESRIAFEVENSDASRVDGEDQGVRGFHQFLKLEDGSADFEFPVEEHPFWLWP